MVAVLQFGAAFGHGVAGAARRAFFWSVLPVRRSNVAHRQIKVGLPHAKQVKVGE